MDTGACVGMEVRMCTGVAKLQGCVGCGTGPARSDCFVRVVEVI